MSSVSDSKAGSVIVSATCIAIPVLTGIVSAGISGDRMKDFGALEQPPLSPPAWLFPLVWTLLYIMMGIALLLIIRAKTGPRKTAVVLFAFQLLMNFLWSPVFFGGGHYMAALTILVLMLISTAVLAFLTVSIDRRASLLLLPYIVWMCFAAYLNAGVALLNT